eukprot:g41575.t1
MGSKEIAEELNRCYASVFTVEDTSSTPELQESQVVGMRVVVITKERVLGKLNGLKMDKSPRPGVYVRTTTIRLYIHELDEGADSIVAMFEDGTNIGGGQVAL